MDAGTSGPRIKGADTPDAEWENGLSLRVSSNHTASSAKLKEHRSRVRLPQDLDNFIEGGVDTLDLAQFQYVLLC